MIEAKNINKYYGQLHVLNDVSISIGRQEIVSIVGRSGAGKTTLLQILGTLDAPDSGTVEYDGRNVLKLGERDLARFRNRNIGFVFQFHQLLPEFTAIENVMIPALIGGDKQSDAHRRAMELLEYMGLADRTDHKPAQLSGGERHRVTVTRAQINHPTAEFSAAPPGSLDSENKAELHRLFFRLRDEMRQTFVIVTHDEALTRGADRIIHMSDGKIITGIGNAI